MEIHMNANIYIIVALVIAATIFFTTFISMIKRYKRCPSDRVLVIFGKVGKSADGSTQHAKCIHGGASFVWPIIQGYQFLDLSPIQISVDLKGALSKQNIRIDVPSNFTVGISTEPSIMQNAAERLLGSDHKQIQKMAEDIILGQLRLTVATMDIEEINSDRDKFYSNISQNVEKEIQKIGLRLINTNITDIKDAAGYIEALGKEAAAKAVNDAKVSVAQKNRDGEIGQANAQREQSVGLAEADREKRIKIASANAVAITGENESKAAIAASDADFLVKKAEADRLALAAHQVANAQALQESYAAERLAEDARADRERASQKAGEIVRAETDKEKVIIAAAAVAEQTRELARGEADAILLRKTAEAKGEYEVLSKQAEGFEKMVKAAGSAQAAIQMMVVDQIETLVGLQTEAIKNIKIDKVTVWDGGNDATPNFLKGMMGSLPPLQEVLKSAGMNLPEWLGKPSDNVKT